MSTPSIRALEQQLTPDTLDTVRQKLGLLKLALEGVEWRAGGFELEWAKDIRPISGLVQELVELVEEGRRR